MRTALFAVRCVPLLGGACDSKILFPVCLCIDSQSRVYALLKLCPLRLKPFQHIIVNTQSNSGFSLRHPPLRLSKKLVIQWRNIRSVNFFIRHAVNPCPICL